jgi:hypothetical protein
VFSVSIFLLFLSLAGQTLHGDGILGHIEVALMAAVAFGLLQSSAMGASSGQFRISAVSKVCSLALLVVAKLPGQVSQSLLSRL